MTGAGRTTKIERRARSNSPESEQQESRDTTLRSLDSGLFETGGQKPSRLSPAPEETDEIALEDIPTMPQLSPPLPYESSQHHDARRERHRRGLSESLRKLEDGCETVVGIRLKAHELRGIIRRERQALTDIDARFMQLLRNILLLSPDDRFKPLLDLYEEMDSRRNLLLPKEDDYNILEDQVNSEEFELEETGKKLLEVLDGVRSSLLGDDDLDSVLEDSAELQSLTSHGNEPLRPELREYLSRIGDRDLVEARLSELRRERAELVEQEQSRIQVGRVLNEESRKFLDEFDTHHASLRQELALVVQDIDKMRKTLEYSNRAFFSATQFDDPGTVPEPAANDVRPVNQHSSPNSNDTPLRSSIAVEQDQSSPILEDDKADSLVREPLLLTENDTQAMFPHLTITEPRSLRYINTWLSEEKMIFPAQFIDDWLLRKLRTSRSEIYQYKRTSALQTVKISEDELKDLVLEWWWSDDAAGDYLRTRKGEARGVSLSSQAVMSSRGVQSDTVLVTMNLLAKRLYRDQATLQVSKSNMRLTIKRTRSIH